MKLGASDSTVSQPNRSESLQLPPPPGTVASAEACQIADSLTDHDSFNIGNLTDDLEFAHCDASAMELCGGLKDHKS
jgi:hypothetical protein